MEALPTMKPLEVVVLIGLFLFTIVVLWWHGKNEAKRVHKVYGSPIYARLCMFGDYVNKCGITEENYNNIVHELKLIRARREMSDPVFCNKADEIAQTFEKRFKEWIPAHIVKPRTV